jgi:integrase
MTTANPALAALVEALKDPSLSPRERAALLESLQALGAMHTSPAGEPTVAKPAAPPKPASRAGRVRLTRSAIDAWEMPKTGERLVYDESVPQLAVRLRPTGASYVVITWDRTRQRKASRTLGKCGAMTPEQARAEATRVVARVVEGEDLRRERDASLTLRELIDRWYAEKTRSKRTADEMRIKLLHYAGSLADRPAREIEAIQIGAIHQHIATKARRRVRKTLPDGRVGWAETGGPGLPATADKWRVTMHGVFKWGRGKGLVDTNPCAGIDAAFDAKGAQRTAYLRGDALLRFWRELERDPDAEARDAFKLLLYTGQRRGNVLSMRWEDLDLSAGVWSLDASKTKQRAAQSTPLVAQASVILAERLAAASTPWVFPAARKGKGETPGHMGDTRLRDAWQRICRAAEIDGLRIHDLRHTAGSWLAKLGASTAIRQKALGHQTPAMAARYAHLELDPVADAMQRMAHAIEAEATKPKAQVQRLKGAAR